MVSPSKLLILMFLGALAAGTVTSRVLLSEKTSPNEQEDFFFDGSGYGGSIIGGGGGGIIGGGIGGGVIGGGIVGGVGGVYGGEGGYWGGGVGEGIGGGIP